MRITNAGGSAYPGGWPGYKVRASTDRDTWRQVDTTYANGVLEWRCPGGAPLVWFAYFAPYPVERHNQLIADYAARPGFAHRELGTSLDGRSIDYLTTGTGAKQVWLYARQHPGESMAEWWMEGALEMLADTGNATTTALLGACTFHIVPNMNPDGSCRGHLRTNSAGVNLTREWNAPSADTSPAVHVVRTAMDETGRDGAREGHGDGGIP